MVKMLGSATTTLGLIAALKCWLRAGRGRLRGGNPYHRHYPQPIFERGANQHLHQDQPWERSNL
jgi:hypothetical protein